MNHLTETWQIHNRINLYLLEAIDETHLNDRPVSKGRNVGEQFAHMHNVRLMWLKVAAPQLLEDIMKIEKGGATKDVLISALTGSAGAVSKLFDAAVDNKVKGFKPNATAFLGYFISHESHHRGQIMLALKEAGHMVDQKIQYGIWEWGSR